MAREILFHGKHNKNWVFRHALADFDIFGYANECEVIGNIHDKEN